MRSLLPLRRDEEMLLPMEREFDRALARFFGVLPEEKRPVMSEWAPRLDIEENEKAILVRVDLPGMEAPEVSVSVEDGMLVLRGERREEREEPPARDRTYHRTERFVARFYRAVKLPPGADVEHIAAATRAGVLTVTIPKKVEAMPRKIEVKPEA